MSNGHGAKRQQVWAHVSDVGRAEIGGRGHSLACTGMGSSGASESCPLSPDVTARTMRRIGRAARAPMRPPGPAEAS